MKYAVIQTGGKQYKVAVGDIITVERLPLAEKADFICNDVLLYNDDGNVVIGTPLIEKITVRGTLLAHVKGTKIRVGKYKAKVRYRKVTGHRQSLSQVQINAIA